MDMGIIQNGEVMNNTWEYLGIFFEDIFRESFISFFKFHFYFSCSDTAKFSGQGTTLYRKNLFPKNPSFLSPSFAY